MRLLRRTPSMGGSGGRGLRRPESLTRSPPATALAKTESMKKREKSKSNKKASKRARLRAGISAALRDLHHLAAHRHRSGGGGQRGGHDDGAVVSVAPPVVGAVSADCSVGARPASAAAGSESGLSWAVAVAVVVVLACVVALGRGPAICCCTCAAWLCGGRAADQPACRRRWSGGGHGRVQRQAGFLQQ
uniref:Uncharacterized protein n=1 Tax=Leersia perrieri TaxID=77586 RepID=A0A0D9XZR6_9ORYZ